MRYHLLSTPQWRRAVAAAVLFMYSSACTSWQVVGPTPSDYFQTHRPREVQVTRSDSSRIKVRMPELRGDTLFGTVGGGLAQGDTVRRVIIPVADLRGIGVRQFSVGKTLGLSLAILVPLLLVAGSGCYGYPCQ
jgi:hypothetical protein